jgi:hypothetical protein
VRRSDSTYEDMGAAPWLRAVLLPVLVFAVAVAIVCGLVFGGAVQGHRTYLGPAQAPTTQPTVLIEP